MPENLSVVIKSADARYMFLISSNAYEDRATDIVREKALTEYVDHFKPNPHLYWHGGDPIGEIIAAEMHGPFLLEVSRELSDARINLARDQDEPPLLVQRAAVWDALEKNTIPWGASISFYYQKGDEQDRVYETILKKETSTLPLEDAANGITLSNVIGGENMSSAVKNKRRNVLEFLNLKREEASQIDAAMEQVRAALDKSGVARKELDTKKVKGLVEDMQARIMELVSELTDDDAMKSKVADAIIAELMGTATDIVDQMPDETMAEDVPPEDQLMPEQMMELAEQVKALASDSLEREAEMKEFLPAFIEMANIVKDLAPLAQKAAAFDALVTRVEAVEKVARLSPSQASRDVRTSLKTLGVDTAKVKAELDKGLSSGKTVLGIPVKE